MPGGSGLPRLSEDTPTEAHLPPYAQASGGAACVDILFTYWLVPEHPIRWWHIVHSSDCHPSARYSKVKVTILSHFLSFGNSDQLHASWLHCPLVRWDYNADVCYAFFLSQFFPWPSCLSAGNPQLRQLFAYSVAALSAKQ